MELCLWIGKNLTENLRVKIKRRAETGNILGVCYKYTGVCYRSLNQDDWTDEALYRQIGAASRSQSLVLVWNLTHPSICWMDNTREHKQSRRFLKCINDDLFLQVTKKPMKRGALLDIVLTKKEMLVKKVKLKSSLCCSVHETSEFKILRAARRTLSKLTMLDFKRADFGLFRNVLGRAPWDEAMEEKVAQEIKLTFKNHLLQHKPLYDSVTQTTPNNSDNC